MNQDTFLIRFERMARDQALLLANVLEEAPVPDALAASVNEQSETPSLWAVEAHYAQRPDRTAVLSLVDDLGLELPPMQICRLAMRDWVGETLKNLPPVIAGRFLLHGSHDRDKRQPGKINLEIDASTAFGTGHHGTTHGCLMALDGVLRKSNPRRILDIGCGTGVLGLAAAAVSRCRVLATDIDPQAVSAAHRTAQRNALSPWFHAVIANGTDKRIVQQSGPYDLIFANILARPLVAMAKPISSILAQGGTLILSGLTHDQQQMVYHRYRQFALTLQQRIHTGPWTTLILKK